MRRKIFGTLLVAAVVTVAPACQFAKVGARCSAASGAARNDTHVLFCVKGRWKATVTIGQAADIIMSTWPASIDYPATPTFNVKTGAALPIPGVRVLDKGGRAAAGARIQLIAPGLFAGADSVDLTTDANGWLAMMTSPVRIGTRPGSYAMRIVGGPAATELATWTMNVTGGKPASVALVSGGDQTITAGGTFQPWIFEVRDATGAPADTSGYSLDVSTGYMGPDMGGLSWSTSGSRLTVTAPPQTVARSGAVVVRYSQPTPWGTPIVVEKSAGWTVAPGPVDDAEVTGDEQSTPVGTRFGQELTVQPIDEFGNRVRVSDVTFAVLDGASGSSGTLTVIPQAGPNAAIAYVDANNVPGDFTVRATVAGLGSYDFTLTITP